MHTVIDHFETLIMTPTLLQNLKHKLTHRPQLKTDIPADYLQKATVSHLLKCDSKTMIKLVLIVSCKKLLGQCA